MVILAIINLTCTSFYYNTEFTLRSRKFSSCNACHDNQSEASMIVDASKRLSRQVLLQNCDHILQIPH